MLWVTYKALLALLFIYYNLSLAYISEVLLLKESNVNYGPIFISLYIPKSAYTREELNKITIWKLCAYSFCTSLPCYGQPRLGFQLQAPFKHDKGLHTKYAQVWADIFNEECDINVNGKLSHHSVGLFLKVPPSSIIKVTYSDRDPTSVVVQEMEKQFIVL